MDNPSVKKSSLFGSLLLGKLFSESGGIQTAVFLLGKVSLVAAVGLAHAMGNNISAAKHRKLPSYSLKQSEQVEGETSKKSLAAYNQINARNIFGAVKRPEAPVVASQAPQPTTLKLRLVGTNVSSDTPPFAIIEDTSKKTQDIFDLNQMIFDQAKLVAVETDSVKIEHNGKVEVLLIEDGAGGSSASSEGIQSTNDDQTQFTVPEKDLEDALANLPLLLSQARAVPYFRNGKSIGMRLFAIRRGSLYEKLGLRNGDIVKAVNATSLTDPAQALKLFEQLKNERSIAVKVERSGQDIDLSYSID